MDGDPLQGQIGGRASKKLKNEELLWSSLRRGLRHELDRVPLWRGDLASSNSPGCGQHLYLPRLKSEAVLIEAIRERPD